MNIDELQRKADKLVETLKEAKSLINDLAKQSPSKEKILKEAKNFRF